MSTNLNNALAKVPRKSLYIIGTAIACILMLVLWLGVTKGLNGISDFFFWRAAHAKQVAVDQKLEKADKQQAVVDQTLLRLAESEKKLAEATKAREESERIFNDASKTSKEKVAAFKDALDAAPIHTDPNSVTDDDLCARAKAAGSSDAVLAALCTH